MICWQSKGVLIRMMR